MVSVGKCHSPTLTALVLCIRLFSKLARNVGVHFTKSGGIFRFSLFGPQCFLSPCFSSPGRNNSPIGQRIVYGSFQVVSLFAAAFRGTKVHKPLLFSARLYVFEPANNPCFLRWVRGIRFYLFSLGLTNFAVRFLL